MTEASLEKLDADGERAVRVSVLLPLPFPTPLDYLAREGALSPGDLVAVPLGRRQETGCVWDTQNDVPADLAPAPARSVPMARLKPVLERLDMPSLPGDLRRFIDWLAAYTLTPPGLVLAMAIRARHTAPTRVQLGWIKGAADTQGVRMTTARQRVLDAVGAEPVSTAALTAETGVSPAVLRGLAAVGLLQEAPLVLAPLFAHPDPDFQPPHLSQEQKDAATELTAAVHARSFGVTLLEGVTGSGKTEVYFEAIAACLAEGRQCLVLLPEIALSTQWTDRFERRFGVQPALWHSELGGKKRRETWHAIAQGQASVVVGARSALFLPFPDLGLIIVDEEHESAFKQEEGVTYHGRDMAVVRARLADVPAILVSATPSLETLTNVETGRYRHVVLHSRHGDATLPDVQLIDMRRAPPERGQFLSPALIDAIQATFERQEQAMLFLNRRGYAPLTLCRACGHRMECPNCSAWLVEHRARQILTCHHCGHNEPLPDTCPACDAEASLVAVGPGIERVHEEARLHFPEAHILVMASDTLGSPSATAEAVRRISECEIDLVIGTQIVAKGWHFPDLTLVGVVDADLGLGGGDLRAAERTVQLLHQVAGRAGRAEKPGTVLLQSYLGDHPVMKALVSNDYLAFMDQEAAQRKPGFWPPYGRLAALIVSADSAEAADRVAAMLGARAPDLPGVQVLGPAPAPLAILRGRHRRRLLLRTRRNVAVQPILRHWLDGVKLSNHERIDVDIDPISFL